MDAHKGAAGGGGEVRRINVVYFLSRGGRTDHPHLFRVNHLNRAGGGVRLRGTYVRLVGRSSSSFHFCRSIFASTTRDLRRSMPAAHYSFAVRVRTVFRSLVRSDVKRWLSELRGKDMPDNYSWSYKRYSCIL